MSSHYVGQIRRLIASNPLSRDEYGGKITHLSTLLSKRKYHIPDGICIPAYVYHAALATIGVLAAAEDICSVSTHKRQVICSDVHNRILNDLKLDTEINLQVRTLLHELAPSNSVFAIRSSSTVEDTRNLSFAGMFDSFLSVGLDELEWAIKKCWASLWAPGNVQYLCQYGFDPASVGMAVLIQLQIDAEWSGVTFTESPFRSGDRHMLIDVLQGTGNEGANRGGNPMQYQVARNGKTIVQTVDTSSDTQMPEDLLIELAELCRQIEHEFGISQDIEWAVDRVHKIWILQSRPITTHETYASVSGNIISVSFHNRHLIPSVCLMDDKVQLRLMADQLGLPVGRRWLITIDSEETPRLPDELIECPLVSFTLIYPRLLQGKTVRQFSSSSQRVSDFADFCRRVAAQENSTFYVIVLEISPRVYTGMATMRNGYLLTEFAFGSYLTKGIVPLSSIVFDSTGRIVSKEIIFQNTQFVIEDGKPVEQEINRLPVLEREQLMVLYSVTDSINHERPNAIVEFGIRPDGALFITDLTDDSTELPISNTVVSHGIRTGLVIRLTEEQFRRGAHDAHFVDKRQSHQIHKEVGDVGTIYVVENMYLTLKNLILEVNPSTVGFIFHNGSILNHLAIMLRELKIPAIIVRDTILHDSLADGQMVQIDTFGSSFNCFQRL